MHARVPPSARDRLNWNARFRATQHVPNVAAYSAGCFPLQNCAIDAQPVAGVQRADRVPMGVRSSGAGTQTGTSSSVDDCIAERERLLLLAWLLCFALVMCLHWRPHPAQLVDPLPSVLVSCFPHAFAWFVS